MSSFDKDLHCFRSSMVIDVPLDNFLTNSLCFGSFLDLCDSCKWCLSKVEKSSHPMCDKESSVMLSHALVFLLFFLLLFFFLLILFIMAWFFNSLSAVVNSRSHSGMSLFCLGSFKLGNWLSWINLLCYFFFLAHASMSPGRKIFFTGPS